MRSQQDGSENAFLDTSAVAVGEDLLSIVRCNPSAS